MEHNYSEKWKKRGDRTGLIRNALLKSMGYTDKDIEKPIIGIINTWAETNPGHIHFRQLSEAVNGLMSIPNLITLAVLAPEAARLTKEYRKSGA